MTSRAAADLASDSPGVTILEERYDLGAVLGAGGMGVAYVAHDRALGIDVAVKILHPEHCQEPEVVRRFEQEAELAARMLSPHVVKVLGRAVTRDGAPCIVYEHLEGETLAARLDRKPAMSLDDVCSVVLQVARALSRAHAVGVVHRDVKPANIFLVAQPTGRPLVKLLDLGVAEQVRPGGAASSALVGTTLYLSPEVLFGPARPDARADLYALGVTAYECLTGTYPYPPECFDDLHGHMMAGNRRAVRLSRPELPEAIDDWMDRALHPDPYWRFASARELAAELEQVARTATGPRRPAGALRVPARAA